MTAYPTCSTCKHWDNSPTWAQSGQIGYCPVLCRQVYVEGNQDSAYALDTPASFGCLLHSDLAEAKA